MTKTQTIRAWLLAGLFSLALITGGALVFTFTLIFRLTIVALTGAAFFGGGYYALGWLGVL